MTYNEAQDYSSHSQLSAVCRWRSTCACHGVEHGLDDLIHCIANTGSQKVSLSEPVILTLHPTLPFLLWWCV